MRSLLIWGGKGRGQLAFSLLPASSVGIEHSQALSSEVLLGQGWLWRPVGQAA